MDFEPYDSSGTDDDLPPSHQNKIPRPGRVPVNGKSAVMGSVPRPRMHKESDMETQIHQLEQIAYISVLRAFKAQADAITWEKESLITELRKELRLSNEEHRELLARVNADDVLRKLREWRQSVGTQQGINHAVQPVADPVPAPSVSASRKKQKIAPSVPSQSFGDPSSFHSQPVPPANHPSSSNAKRGMNGPKGKKQKSNQMLPGVPPTKVQNPSSGPNGRVQAGSRISSGAYASDLAEAATFNTLIGKKVRARWPDDNNFYEAVITDYNSVEDRHALAYDQGTPTETWEWIKLSEISPGDIQWEGEDPGIYNHGGYGGTGHGMNGPGRRDGGPGAGRVRGMTKGHSRKNFLPLQNCIAKKAPEDIKLLNTDTLVKEVERIFSANHPDPLEVEEAKKVLKDHEKALADAIARLADLSDGEDGGGGYVHGRASKENSRQGR